MMTYMGFILLSSSAFDIDLRDGQIFCFSVGMLMMLIVNGAVVSAMIHTGKNFFDDPALFLVLAPIAQAAVAYERIIGDPAELDDTPLFTRILLYIDTFLLIFFVRCGYKTILGTKRSTLIGMHWTYTFPAAGLAAALVCSADRGGENELAWSFAVGSSVLATGIVAIASMRFIQLMSALLMRRARLDDPILVHMEKQDPTKAYDENHN